MRTTGRVAVAAAIGAVTLLTAGCLAGSDKTTGDKGANTNTSKTVTIMFAFQGTQQTEFENAIKPWAQSQGITVNFQSSSDFNNQINLKVKANDLPDIALFPQPGILRDIAESGKLADLDDVVDVPSLKQAMVSDITVPGTVDGKVYGIPPSINVKSLVFYPKKAWATAGYEAPTTMDELLASSQQIQQSGKTPWCMGIESGTGTGWPATDWIEQLVLNYGGLDQYNDWVSHGLKFDSPLVKQAADYFQKIFASPGFVNGGQSAIASNAFGTAGNPMFSDPPGCQMFKQGNFITLSGFFPDSVLADTDANIGVFEFPGKTAADKPVEGGGDLAGLFSGNNDSAKKLMQFTLTKDFCTNCAKAGGYISPFKDFDSSNYPNELTKSMADIAYNATEFAFDGSDQMPGAVGEGTFWKNMTAWINGTMTLDEALTGIDESWPTS